MSKNPIRFWVRGFLAFDAAVQRAVNLQDSLRDELFLSWVPIDERTKMTTALYSREHSYLPGEGHVERGLFPAEECAFRARPVPPGSRILLGAAGTGRELMVLVERGYEVIAFDPCSPFANAARSIAPNVKFFDASYIDIVHAVERGTGPLAFLCHDKPIDAVMFGWGSLSHVLPHIERVRLFRALHELAPKAPLFTSFLYRPDMASFTRGRARNALKRIFTTLGAPSASEKGDHFSPYIGFFSALGREDIEKLGAECDYDVIHFEAGADAYAVFEPKNP